jgi:hypothetical protein
MTYGIRSSLIPAFVALSFLILSPKPSYAESKAMSAAPSPSTKQHLVTLGFGAMGFDSLPKASPSLRAMYVWSLASHMYGEGFLSGFWPRSRPQDSATQERLQGVDIGFGLRWLPWDPSLVSPYLAARISHFHFFPDPFHTEGMDPPKPLAERGTFHRFGLGVAAGFEVGVPKANSPLRVGMDGEIRWMTLPGLTATYAGFNWIWVRF